MSDTIIIQGSYEDLMMPNLDDIRQREERIKAYMKKYRLEHKNEMREYRNRNKDHIDNIINTWRQQVVNCERCGNKVKKGSYAKHKRSKMCENYSKV